MQKTQKKQVAQFISMKPERISLHVGLKYVYDMNNRCNLHIVIDDLTTIKELRDAWGKIDRAREELKKWQGSDVNGFSFSLMLDLEEQKKRLSYKTLSMDMNFDALVYLIWSVDKKKGEKFTKGGWITLINHFQALGIKNKSIQELEQQGIRDLAEGKIPWKLKTGPVTQRRIIDALRQFDLEKRNNKIVVLQDMSTNYIFQCRITTLVSNYWMQAMELIKQFDPEGFSLYEDRWNDRTEELILKNREFMSLNSQ